MDSMLHLYIFIVKSMLNPPKVCINGVRVCRQILWKANFADYKLDSGALTILIAINGGNLGGNNTRTDSA